MNIEKLTTTTTYPLEYVGYEEDKCTQILLLPIEIDNCF